MSGWKDWQEGEIVYEDDFQSFVQDQVVQKYADPTARSAALGTAVAEGMVSYLENSKQVEVFDGSSWVNFTGDITQVTAGTALTGGGTEGNVTLDVDMSGITIDPNQVNGTAVIDNDSRLSDARTPTAHASTHESGGSDELSLAGNQIAEATPTSVGVVLGSTGAGNDPVAYGQNSEATGAENTHIGGSSGSSNSGLANTVVGYLALSGGNSQNEHVAIGHRALSSNTTGSENTAIGGAALRYNTTGTENVAIGVDALVDNETGSQNVAIGYRASWKSVGAGLNTVVGFEAGAELTTGISNVFVGRWAGNDMTTGSQNVFIGQNSASVMTTGSNNIAIGQLALESATSGDANVSIGRRSLIDFVSGDDNTAIGYLAGDNLTSGGNNSFLGFLSRPSSATVSNEITLGNSSITSLRCNATLSSLSDERDKTNIQESPLGLDLIQKLRPVTFDWDRRDGSMAGMKDVGFIAQDVVEVEDELGIEDTLRMSYRSNPEKLEVAPARLIPVLTKAIQELSEQNAELKARLDKLEGK